MIIIYHNLFYCIKFQLNQYTQHLYFTNISSLCVNRFWFLIHKDLHPPPLQNLLILKAKDEELWIHLDWVSSWHALGQLNMRTKVRNPFSVFKNNCKNVKKEITFYKALATMGFCNNLSKSCVAYWYCYPISPFQKIFSVELSFGKVIVDVINKQWHKLKIGEKAFWNWTTTCCFLKFLKTCTAVYSN